MQETNVQTVTVGSLAPEFSLPSLSGETVTLSNYRAGKGDKNVIVFFMRAST